MTQHTSQPPQHEVFFVPLKELWLSFLNSATRDKFPESDQTTSRYFISTSVFLDQFWPTVPRSIQSTVSAERAWFGIRSIMNGGRLGHTITRFKTSDFSQLSSEGKIPKGDTKNYFSDPELKSVIEAQNIYSDWKRKGKKYDELDLVLAAYDSYSGVAKIDTDEIRQIHHADKKAIETLVNRSIEQDIMLSANLERFMRKNRDDKALFKGLKRFIRSRRSKTEKSESQFSQQSLVGQTRSGLNVFKTKLTSSHRIFFSYVSGNEFNNKRAYILAREICHTNDQNSVVNKICNNLADEEIVSDHSDLEPSKVSEITLLDVDGPLKPVLSIDSIRGFEDLFDPNNICLDSNQISAISDNVPLLIDGLAGTGKTAILAARAALRLAPVAPTSTLLVTAAMPHVVSRISDGVKKRTEKHRTRGEIELNMNYCGLDSEIGHVRTIEELNDHFPISGFDEIILDECQDLTFLEFEVLSRITKGKNPRRFAIAGDPMQTLNPTGFDWSKIVALFRDKGVSEDYTVPSKFHMNYRSQSNIVHLANGIQRIRQKATGTPGVVMDSRRSPLDAKPYLVHIHTENDSKALRKIIHESGKGKNDAIVICWATDDASLSHLLEGGDSLLSGIWDELKTEDYDKMDGFRTKFLIHSSSSIKGDEQNAVILYNFASDQRARENLASLTQNFDDISVAKAERKIAIDYAYSRLYVAITRAFDHVFVIENDEGFEFWQDCKFVDEKGESIDLFEESNLLSTVVASRQDVFKASEETTIANFHKNRKKWDEETNVDGLKIAVNIGEQLLKDIQDHELAKEYWRLRGELSWRNSTIANTDEDRDHHLANSLSAFEKAGLPGRIAPIYFAQRKWAECRALMREKSPFHKLIAAYCSIQLNDEVSITDVKDLRAIKKSPQGWDVSPPKILENIKSNMLELIFERDDFHMENKSIFENRDWFGVAQILDFIVKQNLECKLLLDLWEDKEDFYHDASAQLFAKSVIRVLKQGIEGIDELDDYRRRFVKLEDRFRKTSITIREKWLFKEVEPNSDVNTTQGEFFVKNNSMRRDVLITMRKSINIPKGYQEKAKVLHHAHSLLEDYLTSSRNPETEFRERQRLHKILTLMNDHPWYPSLSNLPDLKALLTSNAIFEFIYDLSQIIKSDSLQKKSRFSWLNEAVYFNQLALSVDSEVEKYSDQQMKLGFPVHNDLQTYYAGRMMYHVASVGGRKFPIYQEALEALSLHNPNIKNYIGRIWDDVIKYLADSVNDDQPLTDAEFKFILSALRHNLNAKPRDKKIGLSKQQQNRLFNSNQSEMFSLELMKLKFVWPYNISDGTPLKKRPKPRELDTYLKRLAELGLQDERDLVLRSLPKDPKEEMSKFHGLTTYQKFWEFLVETSKSFKDFDKMVEDFTFKSWIKVINGLDWGEFTYSDLNTIEFSDRRSAFNHITDLAEFDSVLETKNMFVGNGLFFLQFASSIDYYIGNLPLVIDNVLLGLDDNDTSLLIEDLEVILDRLDPRELGKQKSLKQASKGGKTLEQRRKEQEKVKRFDELKKSVTDGFDVIVMYRNRIAAELFDKSLRQLEVFADQFNLEVTNAATKKTMLKRVLKALSVEDTEVGNYLLG